MNLKTFVCFQQPDSRRSEGHGIFFHFLNEHFKASTQGHYSEFTGQAAARLPSYIFGLLGLTFLPEEAQVSLLDSDYFGADFNNIIQAVPVLH